MKTPTFFLAGCQKSASTWIYHCMLEHPDVFVPEKDALHFFTINYYKGLEWYIEQYNNVKNEKAIVDPTPSYLRDIMAPKRIYKYNPEAKFIISLRNPTERAFSHYWHEKKKNKINFEFDEAINYSGIGNYDIYSDWILTGFYYEWIQLFMQYFPKDNFLFLLFDDLKRDPMAYIKEIYSFLEVEREFEPKSSTIIINKASNRLESNSFQNRLKLYFRKKLKINTLSEYDKGIDETLKKQIIKIFIPEIEKLEKFLNRDLDTWKK